MEFEFDKEIDAILRKARESEVVFADNPKSQISNPKSFHLDADMLSAFAENALPEKTKQLYTVHLAECDRCRQILSNLIILSSEAEIVPLVSTATITETPIPWYRKLFLMPNLAYTMGAFVLIFGGFLGVLVLQNTDKSGNTLSQATESSSKQSGPSFNQDTGFSAANSNAQMSNSAATTSANTTANTAANPANATSNATTINRAASSNSASITRENETAGKPEMSKTAPITAPAPMMQGEVAPENKEKEDKRAEETDTAMAMPPPPANAPAPKAKKQMSDDEGSKLSATRDGATAIKQVGSKTFRRVNSAWVDSAYRENTLLRYVSRGSDDYKKLDREVRNIAENMDGIVIVIWKSKGYRIQ